MNQRNIPIGLIDYSNTGHRFNLVEIDVKLVNGCFSMSGGIWKSNKSDYLCCGQMLDEIGKYFPDNKNLQALISIWREYHLNDLTPGTPKQMAYLKSLTRPRNAEFYTWACEQLKKGGLLVDTHNNKPYTYGSKWLKTTIPRNVKAQIKRLTNALDKQEN